MLNDSGIGYYVDDVCVSHVFYADDLCLIALSAIALQQLLNICHRYSTTSNIGVSIISLHDTPRLHTLKRVIRNLIVWRTYK